MEPTGQPQPFNKSEVEKIQVIDIALSKMINHYCIHEAGVRILRKCLDWTFNKIATLMEKKKYND